MKLFGIALAFALACVLSVAHAQRAMGARELYERGIAHYKIGEFEQAIVDFKAAYAIEPSGVLLFNLAQAHRQLGDGKRALFFYREFIRQAPPSDARTDAEHMVAELEAPPEPTPPPVRHTPPAHAVETATAPVVVPTRGREHESGHGLDRRGAITLVATTAAVGTTLVLVGAGLSVHAESVADSLEHLPQGTVFDRTYRARYDEGRASTDAATAMYVIGGSAIAASIISAVICRRVLSRQTRYAAAGDFSWHF